MKITFLYACNTKENTECKKSSCLNNGGRCMCTANRKYALKYNNGEPMIVHAFADLDDGTRWVIK